VLRLTEIALLVLPLLAFVTWRLLGGGRELPAGTVAAMGFALAVFAVALFWFGLDRVLPPNAPYVPAQVGAGGRIVGPVGGR